jgi:O-antigen/teichoic acid export membrane protein
MLIRSALIYGPAILFPRLAAFGLALVLTRLLPPREFGLYALVVLIGEIADMSCSNWIRLSMLRLDAGYPGTLRSSLVHSIWLTLAGTTLAITVTVPVSLVLEPEHFASFALSVACYVVANSLLKFGLTALQILEQRVTLSGIEVVRSACFLVSASAATFLIAPSFAVPSLIGSAVTLASALVAITLAFRSTPAPVTGLATELHKRMSFGIPLIVVTLVSYLFGSSERFLLSILTDPAVFGMYAAAYVIARQPIDVLSNSINSAAFPELVKSYEQVSANSAAALLSRVFMLCLALTFPTTILLIVLCGPIAKVLLPLSYQATAETVIPWIAVGTLLLNIKTFVFDNVFHLVQRNWLQCTTFLPATLATVATGLVVIIPFGALGAAIAMCAGALAGLVASVLMSGRYLPLPVPWYDIVKICSATIIAVLAALAVEESLFRAHETVRVVGSGLGSGLTYLVTLILLRPTLLRGGLQRRSASGPLAQI